MRKLIMHYVNFLLVMLILIYVNLYSCFSRHFIQYVTINEHTRYKQTRHKHNNVVDFIID